MHANRLSSGVFSCVSGKALAGPMAGLTGHVWSFDELFEVVLK
jgi:hypothetical protein